MDGAIQPYVDPATLQAADNMHGMDAAAIAAAAQQLEAIHAALQQASNSDQMTAALEHLSKTQPEDYLAHLAVVNAVAASAAEGVGGGQLVELHNEEGHDAGGAGDKPLTSRFRGVCWNKKNRRWQAAINSSGKYIYLGSFVQEEEAARAFDKAAIRLRGNRAKLNYSLSDYVDDNGQLVEDPRLSAHLQNVLGKEPGKGGKGGPGDGHDLHGGLLGAGLGNQNLLYNNNLTQVRAAMHILGQGKSPHYPYSGAQKQAYGVVDVPEGSTLTAHIPGDEEAFAVLYKGPHVPAGGLGALVWDGSGAIDLGTFDTENDARNAAGAVLKLAMFYKHTLQSAIANQSDQSSAQQQAASSLAQYGLLLGGSSNETAGSDTDAAAMAAAAAAAASDPSTLALVANLGAVQPQLDVATQNQYKDLFSWLANAGQKKPEDGVATNLAPAPAAAATGSQAGQHTEADLAGAEAITAMMMAVGGVKNAREGEDGQGGGEEGPAKRSRMEDSTAQIKQLSAFKLQDVMKTLFEPTQQQAPQTAGH